MSPPHFMKMERTIVLCGQVYHELFVRIREVARTYDAVIRWHSATLQSRDEQLQASSAAVSA